MRQARQRTFVRLLAIVIVVAGLAVIPVIAQKASSSQIPGGRAGDAARHSDKAAEVIRDIMGAPDRGIPTDLLRGAEAVIVCPEVIKAALGLGGSKGQCAVSRRTSGGWGTPVFYNLTGGSIGVQIGGDKADYVLQVLGQLTTSSVPNHFRNATWRGKAA
jgi:lipid-binding SYLF domain-containing protein